LEGSQRPVTSHARVGSLVRGKYRVDAFLATGTMATVFAATHRNGARVALKVMHAQLALDPSLCERFKREGYFANAIGHPGVVRAIDDDVTEDGCAFIVMELLEGETLEERRKRKGGKLDPPAVLPVADALLDILAAAHAQNVVHRDLKPDNVFLTKDGEVKVLDFGVARWNDGKSSSDMTGVGMVLGTPAFMPPEQAIGKREDVDAQSDIWAVGATLFVALTGEPVHTGGDAMARLIATARNPARPLREVAPEVPRYVAAVIDRALAFQKKDRWPDAAAMREAIRWARRSLEEETGPETALASNPLREGVPPPLGKRRAVDDEPTIMRSAPSSEDGAESAPPASNDFLTSAPPITLRDLPKAAPASPSSSGRFGQIDSDPAISLRHAKVGEPAPSTERIPHAEAARDLALARAAHADAQGAPTPVGGLPVGADMATYDPSAADLMGSDAPTSDPSLLAAESADPPGSMEVSVRFTNPMLAAPTGHGGLPEGPLSPMTTSVGAAGAAPAMAIAVSPMHAEGVPAAEPSLGRGGAPGPLVAQVTAKPSALRVVIPLALALCVLAAAVAFVLRTRAANARVGASTGLVSTSSPLVEEPKAEASGATGAAPTTAPEPRATEPEPRATEPEPRAPEPRAPTAEGDPAASAAAPATSASADAKKAKARGKHHAKPATAAAKSADEAPSAPVVTSTEPATSPGEDTSKAPKEAQPAPMPMATSMPQAVPAPAPQPVPQPVPTPVEAP
jgi:serine/threonine-protein kinase